MPDFYEMFETPKIHWPITFVVDTSGSMTGQRLVQLNSALHELSNILESLAYQGDIQLSIRLIEFNTTARYLILFLMILSGKKTGKSKLCSILPDVDLYLKLIQF